MLYHTGKIEVSVEQGVHLHGSTEKMMMPTFYATAVMAFIFMTVNSSLALVPCQTRQIFGRNFAGSRSMIVLQRSSIKDKSLQSIQHLGSLHSKRSEVDDDISIEQSLLKEDEQSLSSMQSPMSIMLRRIQAGDTLDILAVSVIGFFLATAWLSGGRLFNDYTQNYNSVGQGKSQLYKYVDADEILREDFDRETSKVMF